MEPSIDRQISKAQSSALQKQNFTLLRQNQLLKQQVAQLKSMHAQTQKELSVYKSIVLKGSSDSQRIFELQTQLEMLQGKYSKLLKSGGSQQTTEYQMKCRDYQRKLKDNQIQYQKQLSILRDRLAKQKAIELVDSKRLITSPHGEVKKSSMGLGKFV